MGKGTIKTKAMTMAVAMSMVAGLCPSTVFAASGSVVAKDGTYTATKHVVNNPDDENDWDEYDVEVSLTVSDGKFSNITVTPKNGYDSTTNDSYFNKAYNKSKGINTLLKDKDATEDTINGWDTKTGATCTATAVKAAALEAIQSAPAASTEVTVDTTALSGAIASAEALKDKEEDYTAESWSNMQEKLTAAKMFLLQKNLRQQSMQQQKL